METMGRARMGVGLGARWLCLALCLCVGWNLVACSEDEEPAPPTYDAASGRALALDEARRGIPYQPRISALAPRQQIRAAGEASRTLVLEEQLFSEYEFFRGTPQNTGAAAYDALVSKALSHGEVPAFLGNQQRIVLALDLFRLDESWLIDWQGLRRDTAPDARQQIHFGVADYTSAIRTRLTRAIQALPEGVAIDVVLGVDMERYWLKDPERWASFVDFVHEVAPALRAEREGLRVSVGFNWYRFVHEVAATWPFPAPTEADPEPEPEPLIDGRYPSYLRLVAAWQAVIDPLYYRTPEVGAREALLDFYALSFVVTDAGSLTPAQAVGELSMAGLWTRFRLEPDTRLPLAFVRLGWPVTTQSGADRGEFLTRWLAAAGDLAPDYVVWFGLHHFDDAGDCGALTGAGAPIRAARWRCYRGLFQVNGQPVWPQLVRDLLGLP